MRDAHIEIEDAVTARMKLRHPEIRRIGVKASGQGLRCYQVWTVSGAPTSYEVTDKFLAVADAILMRITGGLNDPWSSMISLGAGSRGGCTFESRWRE
jgi:hypothetical protein